MNPQVKNSCEQEKDSCEIVIIRSVRFSK